MLNINWRQIQKINANIKDTFDVADNDHIEFNCITQNPKTGIRHVIKKKTSYKNFNQIFWELYESPLIIIRILVSDKKGTALYRYGSQNHEVIPSGGLPHIIKNWNKLHPTQKEVWLQITLSQIESNA